MKYFTPIGFYQYIFRIFIPAIFLLSFNASAQQSTIRFNHLSIDDGLSLSSVYCIYEDQKGFKWFGTEDGLNRYNGQNFTVFREEAGNPNSLSYKWTELIFEDSRGQLWFGSKGGLTRFVPETETFTKFTRDGRPGGLCNDTITQIVEGPDRNIWIGTIAGLSAIHGNSDSIVAINLSNKDAGQEPTYIHAIFPLNDQTILIGTSRGLFSGNMDEGFQRKNIRDVQTVFAIRKKDDTVWLGTDNGLVKTMVETNDFELFPIEPSASTTRDNSTENFLFDFKNQIWVSTPEGLYRFDLKTNNYTKTVNAVGVNQSLSIAGSRPLMIDAPGEVWYGTYGSGLYKINPQTNKVSQYLHNTGDPNSLSQNSINCLYEDRAGVIWIGTFGAGINVFDKYAHKFPLITHNPQDPNSLSDDFIWSICEARDGSLWVGTNSGGLNHFNPKSGTFKHYHHDTKNSGSLSAESVREVYQDSEDNIWVGTDGGGLCRFLPENNSFISYKSIPGTPTTISDNSVRVIYEDRSGNLWVGTRNGLNKFDKDSGEFKQFLHDPNIPGSLSHNFVYSSIIEDMEGNLWIGTYGGGLNKMDRNTESFQSYTHNPDELSTISNDIVFSIYDENDSILWIGTNDGLNRFNRNTGRFQRFGTTEGLPNDVVYGVLPDQLNNLWLSTNSGICRFNISTFSTKNFDKSDGLQSNEFNGGAFFKGPTGNLYFGGVYGFNIIDPERVYQSKNKVRVVISSIDVMGKKVKIASPVGDESTSPGDQYKITESGDDFIVHTAVPYIYEIKVDYVHRFLGFEFVAMNLPPSQQVTYSYKMENLDEDWTFAGKRNYVTYANLSPGKYIFKVAVSDENTKTSSSHAALIVNVEYPWWRTWWFYAIEFLLAITLVGFIYTYLLKSRTNKLLTTQNQKIQDTNRQLSESEQKLKDLNSAKDKFFSIIAHDLKNPFTSLLSIGELLSNNFDSLDEDDKKSGIDGFYKSSKRIYALLENLLVWSRTQTGRVKFNPQIFKLDLLAEECYDLLALSAEKKGIDFRIHVPEEVLVKADREMIHTVLRNLLHNAIKFSHAGGKVILSIVEKEPGLFKVSVEDNGVGMSTEKVEMLFSLAPKTNSDGTAGEKGTGLGLIVCKEFVERNGSKLFVKSKEGEGSEFSFYLSRI